MNVLKSPDIIDTEIWASGKTDYYHEIQETLWIQKPTFDAKLIQKMRLERYPQSNFGHWNALEITHRQLLYLIFLGSTSIWGVWLFLGVKEMFVGRLE